MKPGRAVSYTQIYYRNHAFVNFRSIGHDHHSLFRMLDYTRQIMDNVHPLRSVAWSLISVATDWTISLESEINASR